MNNIHILKKEDVSGVQILLSNNNKMKKIKINIDNRYIYIMKINNEIVGTATLFILEKIHSNNIGLIEDILIKKEYRNKGYGKYLINYLKNVAIKKKCYKIMLDCKKHNILFYEKIGFKIIGTNMAFYVN